MRLEIPDELMKQSEEVSDLVFRLVKLVAEFKPQFDLAAIYKTYPRKGGKKDGLKRLVKKITTQEVYDLAMVAACEMAKKAAIEGMQFIPMFLTWVNQERWLDDADDLRGSDVVSERQVGE